MLIKIMIVTYMCVYVYMHTHITRYLPHIFPLLWCQFACCPCRLMTRPPRE